MDDCKQQTFFSSCSSFQKVCLLEGINGTRFSIMCFFKFLQAPVSVAGARLSLTDVTLTLTDVPVSLVEAPFSLVEAPFSPTEAPVRIVKAYVTLAEANFTMFVLLRPLKLSS